LPTATRGRWRYDGTDINEQETGEIFAKPVHVARTLSAKIRIAARFYAPQHQYPATRGSPVRLASRTVHWYCILRA
jgi:hypothetical protein